MRNPFSKPGPFLIPHIALWSSLLHSLSVDSCHAYFAFSPFIAAAPEALAPQEEPKYTVNFNNVPVIEVIRFIGKIAHLNFVFAENDVQFNVTLMSEEPISIKNIQSALVQVLRIHGLHLLEQEGNLIITSSASVNQIPTIVSGDPPHPFDAKAPIVTRIFRIKNANVSSIAGIIKPLTSQASIVEVSEETRQLIITDVTTNIDKIASLLVSLDTPHTRLDIESYIAKQVPPVDIISMAEKLLAPFAESNPLILVPQPQSNTIFIVSTPYLIERALSVMEDIDQPQKTKLHASTKQLSVHIYHISHKTAQDMLASLTEIAAQLQISAPDASMSLIQALKEAHYVSSTNSLMFVTDDLTWNKVQTILTEIDTAEASPLPKAGKPSQTAYVYRIAHATPQDLLASLEKISKQLQTSASESAGSLIEAFNRVQYVSDTHSLVFVTDVDTWNKIQQILSQIDIANIKQSAASMQGTVPRQASQTVYLYKAIYKSPEELLTSLNQVAHQLQTSSPETSKVLIKALMQAQYVPGTSSLLFTCNESTWLKIQELLLEIDIEGAARLSSQAPSTGIATPKTIHVYKTLYRSPEELLQSIDQIAKKMQATNKQPSSSLMIALMEAQYIPGTSSLLFTSDEKTWGQIQEILSQIDTPKPEESKAATGIAPQGMHIYKAAYRSPEELLASLDKISKQLQMTTPETSASLIEALTKAQYIPGTSSLLFTSDEKTWGQVEKILQEIDTAELEKLPGQAPVSKAFRSVHIYKALNKSPSEVLTALDKVAEQLQVSSPDSSALLIQAITKAQYIPGVNFLLFTCDEATWNQLQKMIAEIDLPSEVKAPQVSSSIAAKSVHIYKPLHKTPQELISSLNVIAKQLQTESSDLSIALIQALIQVQSIPKTNSLLFTADEVTWNQIQGILLELDTSEAEKPSGSASSMPKAVHVYKALYKPSQELLASLEKVAGQLQQTSPDSSEALIQALVHAQLIPGSNSLLFMTDEATWGQVQKILAEMDLKEGGKEETAYSPLAVSQSLYLYKTVYQSPEDVLSSLQKVAAQLKQTAPETSAPLLQAIDQVHYIPGTRSLLFVTDATTWQKIQEILSEIDLATDEKNVELPPPPQTVYIYKTTYRSASEVLSALEKIVKQLQETGQESSAALIQALKSVDYIEGTGSLVFVTDEASWKKVQDILAGIDLPKTKPSTPLAHQAVYVYSITNKSAEDLLSSLEKIAKQLQTSSPEASADLIQALQGVHYSSDTNSFIFVTDEATWSQIQKILTEIDKKGATKPSLETPAPQTVYVYQATHKSAQEILSALEQVSKQLQTKSSLPLKKALKEAQLIPNTNSLAFVTDENTWKKLQEILQGIDVSGMEKPKETTEAPAQTVYVYKIAHASPEELLISLQKISKQLQINAPQTTSSLVLALDGVHYVPDTRSLVFVTDGETWNKVQELLQGIDQSTSLKTLTQKPLEQTAYIYRIIHNAPQDLLASLNKISLQLQHTVPDISEALIQALNSVRYVEDSHSLVFITDAATWKKIQEILSEIDVTKETAAPIKEAQTIHIYQITHRNAKDLISSLENIQDQLEEQEASSALLDAFKTMRYASDTNSLIFVTDESSWAKIQQILSAMDTETAAKVHQSFWMYPLEHTSEDSIRQSLLQMAKTIQDPDLLLAIQNLKWIEESNTLIFSGTDAAIQKLQQIVPTLDVGEATSTQKFYIYKVQSASKSQLESSLKQVVKNLQDKELLETVRTMKWLSGSHSILFQGSSETLSKLQMILPSLDQIAAASEVTDKSNFIIYHPQHVPGQVLKKNLDDLQQKLSSSGLENDDFLEALSSMQWLSSSNSLLFTGSPAALDRIQTILRTMDEPKTAATSMQFFLYKPSYTSEKQLEGALLQFSETLSPLSLEEQALQQTIEEAEWMSDSQAFVFRGDVNTLQRLKEVLNTLDTPQWALGTQASVFVLYKLQYISGGALLKHLDTLTSNLTSLDPQNEALVKAVHELKWIKETNSLLITGTPFVIDRVKALISEFDVPSAQEQPLPAAKTDFFIYKPVYQSPQQVLSSLQELSQDLEQAGFAYTDLHDTMQSARLILSSQSILFTGSSDSIQRMKTLLQTIDQSTPQELPIQMIGSTTFLIYKIKYAAPSELIASLQALAKQLNVADISDRDLSQSLLSVKWIKETESLLFIAPEATLKKIADLLQQFDTPLPSSFTPPLLPQRTPSEVPLITTPPPKEAIPIAPIAPVEEAPSTFSVYTPQHVSGDELINILQDFMQNLMLSGIADQPLFDTIKRLKFVEKTNSLIISGDTESIHQVEALLQRFDLAKHEVKASSITPIAEASFLIYKLQYHKGMEIQAALKKVAGSMMPGDGSAAKGRGTFNQYLLEAINSLQWVETTNSLLATGTPEILSRLKELIQNLDIPLRQVFIEVLVIETSLDNTQNFGLQWGSQLQYLNKTVGAMGNFPTNLSNVNLASPIANTTASNTPIQASGSNTAVPFTTGFDLGVIGDIIFHRGQSFLSLGSLVNAIQVDHDATVVMNPKIISQDGHTSNIFVGQNIPFVGSFVSNTSNNTLQSSNIEYRDVGVNLTLTPTLGTNNIITLEIKQDISEQTANTTTVQGQAVNGIQTTHRTMATRAHVPDKHFLVLSGMIQETKTHFRSGIPCLGGLPVIGALFSENDRTATKSNVIIFIRPFIIDSFEDYDRLTVAEESLYKQQVVLQPLKEEFDAGTEILKSLHDD